MKRARAFAADRLAVAIVTVARGGHELPIYPSYLSARDRDQDDRARPRRRGAARGQDPCLCRTRLELRGPAAGRAPRDRDARLVRRRADQSAIGAGAGRSVGLRRGQDGHPRTRGTEPTSSLHPYPVTPLHGDYLHHADLAAAAKARALRTAMRRRARPQGEGERPSARATGWSATASGLGCRDHRNRRDRAGGVGDLGDERLAGAALAAHRLVPCRAVAGGCARAIRPRSNAVAIEPAAPQEPASFPGSSSASIWSATWSRRSRAAVGSSSPATRVKREYVNVEYSAGIENIGYDAHRGPAFPDVHPHGEAQGLSLERLARARDRRRRRLPPGTRSAA